MRLLPVSVVSMVVRVPAIEWSADVGADPAYAEIQRHVDAGDVPDAVAILLKMADQNRTAWEPLNSMGYLIAQTGTARCGAHVFR